ncbi:MAG TPA: PDZ domain-containing protein [Candidatus Sulfotelmatobacter sp.]|nr:PDZ domain-containing protein [Candidatus Sulfotelmatobacter sp.]
MRKYVVMAIALFPLLFTTSQAAQNTVESPFWGYGYSSDESGTNAYLGVDISDISTERMSALKLKEEKGVEVTMVDQDAPAGKAGLKEHDVILSMNGTSIESGAQLRRMIHETPAGRVVTFDISRDGQPMTIKVQLGDRHKEFPHIADGDMHIVIPPIPPVPEFEMPNVNVVVVHSSVRSGVTVENLTPQLGEFFGVKGGGGVLVRSVEKGSRADKAGLRAGDVVIKVNDRSIHDSSDFMQALRSRNGGNVGISVIRDKKEQNLNLTLPEHKQSGDMLEESFDDSPSMDADSFVDLSQLQSGLAQLGPELAIGIANASKAAEEARKSLCANSKQLRDQAEKLRNQQWLQLKDFNIDEKKLQEEMERLRREMHEFDI